MDERDTHYDIARLILKPGITAPTRTTGYRFSITLSTLKVTSAQLILVYTEAGVTEKDIPSFNSSVNGLVSLKDVIDFRPKVDNSNVVPGYPKTRLCWHQARTIYLSLVYLVSPASTPADDVNLDYTIKFNKEQYLR